MKARSQAGIYTDGADTSANTENKAKYIIKHVKWYKARLNLTMSIHNGPRNPECFSRSVIRIVKDKV